IPPAHAIASVVFPPASRVLRLKRYICAPYPDRLDAAGGPARDKGPPTRKPNTSATCTQPQPPIGPQTALLPLSCPCRPPAALRFSREARRAHRRSRHRAREEP